jgi:hypothetical protein
VRDLLIAAEERVSQHCLVEGNLPDEQVRDVLAHRATVRETVARANAGDAGMSDPPLDDASDAWYARMWGAWMHREEAWFLQCAESVENIDEPTLVAHMHDVRHLADAVGDRWRELRAHAVPDRLVFSPGAGSEATTTEIRLVGYSPFDPLVLPVELLSALEHLDGRVIAQVRDEVAPLGATLDDDLLRQLYDFGVAVPPPQ